MFLFDNGGFFKIDNGDLWFDICFMFIIVFLVNFNLYKYDF